MSNTTEICLPLLEATSLTPSSRRTRPPLKSIGESFLASSGLPAIFGISWIRKHHFNSLPPHGLLPASLSAYGILFRIESYYIKEPIPTHPIYDLILTTSVTTIFPNKVTFRGASTYMLFGEMGTIQLMTFSHCSKKKERKRAADRRERGTEGGTGS